MTDLRKIFLGLAGTAALLLIVAFATTIFNAKLPYGFFVFLRIVTFGALIGLMLEKFPMWLKFVFLLLAILYNPVIPIHIGDRDVWAFFNILTIPVLLIPWGYLWKKLGRL